VEVEAGHTTTVGPVRCMVPPTVARVGTEGAPPAPTHRSHPKAAFLHVDPSTTEVAVLGDPRTLVVLVAVVMVVVASPLVLEDLAHTMAVVVVVVVVVVVGMGTAAALVGGVWVGRLNPTVPPRVGLPPLGTAWVAQGTDQAMDRGMDQGMDRGMGRASAPALASTMGPQVSMWLATLVLRAWARVPMLAVRPRRHRHLPRSLQQLRPSLSPLLLRLP
jgi:hypothetical protein